MLDLVGNPEDRFSHDMETGEQRPNFEGNRGTKTILGNKQFFDFWGTGEQANLFQGNKGTGTHPLGGPQYQSLTILK